MSRPHVAHIVLPALFLNTSLLLLAASQRPATNKLLVPAFAEGVRCVTSGDGPSPVFDNRTGHLLVGCPARGAVHCDSDNTEPLDIPKEAICHLDKLDLAFAQAVGIEAPSNDPIVVDWLRFEPSGVMVQRASRRFRQGGTLAISVAALQDRFVRFSRDGMSPITVHAQDLREVQPWRLPRPALGGELLAVLEPALIPIEALRLVGTQTLELSAGPRRSVSFSGVPKGEYRLVPQFRGGWTQSEIRATILPAASTTIFLRAPRIGAANISRNRELCESAGELVVVRVEESSTGVTPVIVTSPRDKCSNFIKGLAPGEYDAFYRVSGRVLASRRFSVQAQILTEVVLERPIVLVSGQVVLNREPFRGVKIEFSPVPHSEGTRVSALTDSFGRYDVQLPRTGLYDMRLHEGHSEVLGQVRRASFVEGSNAFDWRIIAGTLRVQVSGLRPAAVSINTLSLTPRPVRPDSDGIAFSSSWLFKAEDAQPFVIRGLGFGQYRVNASQGFQSSGGRRSRANSASVTVTLSAKSPDATVTLSLNYGKARLSVKDEFGNPLQDVSVSGASSVVEQPEAGLFVLEGVGEGARLQLRKPGYTPMCKIAPRDTAEVVLHRGVPMTLEIVGATALSAPPGWLLFEGSDCPVPLMYFEYARISSESDDTIRFVINNGPISTLLSAGTTLPGDPIELNDAGEVRIVYKK